MPTSGVAPYVFEATFKDASRIDGEMYYLKLNAFIQQGSCVLDMVTDSLPPEGATSLLETGTWSFPFNIDIGYCFTVSLVIRNIRTNMVVDFKNVYVDNT